MVDRIVMDPLLTNITYLYTIELSLILCKEWFCFFP